MHPFRRYFAEKISCIFFHLDNSVADPHLLDPDPSFYFDADPDPTFLSYVNLDPNPDPTTLFSPELDPPMLQKDPLSRSLQFFSGWCGSGSGFCFQVLILIRIQLSTLMRIRIQLPEMIRIRNPARHSLLHKHNLYQFHITCHLHTGLAWKGSTLFYYHLSH